MFSLTSRESLQNPVGGRGPDHLVSSASLLIRNFVDLIRCPSGHFALLGHQDLNITFSESD
jgi:hypothetical protein